MRAIKINAPDTLLHPLPKSKAERKEVVKLGLPRFTSRRRKKARSIADDTFGALAIRKHAQIEQLIEQTKYGD